MVIFNELRHGGGTWRIKSDSYLYNFKVSLESTCSFQEPTQFVQQSVLIYCLL
jgi:hypothetical protein